MIDKQRGYHHSRPSYVSDASVDIQAGMIAFLATNANGVVVATTAASGTVPIGYFWHDQSATYVRSTVELGTFNANNIITLKKGNIHGTNIKVTNSAGTVTYTNGVNFTTVAANGVVTRGPGIAVGATVVIWYEYVVPVNMLQWENVSTRWVSGQNYDHGTDDALGSGMLAVVEGDAKLWTDQYDVNQAYVLNAVLRSDALSRWSTAATGYPICGRVISVPTAADPFLGLDQIRVAI